MGESISHGSQRGARNTKKIETKTSDLHTIAKTEEVTQDLEQEEKGVSGKPSSGLNEVRTRCHTQVKGVACKVTRRGGGGGGTSGRVWKPIRMKSSGRDRPSPDNPFEGGWSQFSVGGCGGSWAAVVLAGKGCRNKARQR